MAVRDLSRATRERLATLAVMIAAGLLHRRAAIDAWADDRSLAAEPSWVQMAAPLWHAAAHGSSSIANGLVRLLDPFTGASTGGDTRALAALLAGASAGALFLVLRRAGTPLSIAVPLCGVTVGAVLPAAAAASVSHALQMLLGTALILTWSVPASTTSLRAALLGGLTMLGAITHASFLAFAAGVWAAGWLLVARGARARVAIVGSVALALGLLAASWIVAQHGILPTDVLVPSPGVFEVMAGLVTGRFSGHLQPSALTDVTSTLGATLPAPTILSVPLAALAFLKRDTRPLALACLAAIVSLIVFLSDTWLPDAVVGGAPARLAVTVLIGLGLSWVAMQPGRGATTLAIVASAVIGLRGFVEPVPWTVPVQAAQMQAFVEAAPAALAGVQWSTDRLAVGRTLLNAHPELGRSRFPLGADALAMIPDEQVVVVIGSITQRPESGGIRYVPFDVSFPTAERFLDSQPERLWMTVAVNGRTAEGFCNDLLARLGGGDTQPMAPNPALLVRVGSREPRAGIRAADRLAVEYGHRLPGTSQPVPARVAIETMPAARIVINRQVAARTDQGMAIATFDPWNAHLQEWIVGPCDRPVRPAIRERRLGAAYAIAVDGSLPRTPPLAAEPIQVQFDTHDWFGAGWHAAEGSGDTAFRWTSAVDAHVDVVVARPGPLRVRMRAQLAAAEGAPNALGVSWNGTVVSPVGPWAGDGEWLVPAELVRRGINDFAIHVAQTVSPAASGASSDTRALGAAVSSLWFEPGLRPERSVP